MHEVSKNPLLQSSELDIKFKIKKLFGRVFPNMNIKAATSNPSDSLRSGIIWFGGLLWNLPKGS